MARSTTSSPSRNDQRTVADWWGLGDVISLTFERLTAPVEGMHRAITDRWLRLAGPRAARALRTHQAVAGSVYGTVRLTGLVLGTAVGWGATIARGWNGLPSLWHSPLGSGIQAAVNGLLGDELARRGSDMRIELGLRDAHGEPVSPEPLSLVRAYPEPTARLVVLLHGLGETERCWQGQPDGGRTAVGLGGLLAADAFTPLLVRYNTGRHVSENGVALAALLEEIVESWPVAVEDIALVGHSMGGLVARGALHAGQDAGHRWVSTTRHLVALGSPHLGAPLEKGVNLVSWGLRLAPEGRPLGEFLDGRSAGIKDLRFGAIRQDDWYGADPDRLLHDVVDDVPPPEGVGQHFIAGVVTADPAHPIGVLVGDLMVRSRSGTGRGRRRRIEATDVRVLGGRRHFDLLWDPAVHEQIRVWLTARTGERRD